MATRGTISTMIDGKCVGIYSHWDNYPSCKCPLLMEFYPTQEDAIALVSLGAASSIRQRLSPNTDETHDFDNPVTDVSIFYHRDRGEEFYQLTGNTKDDVCDEEYSYHFENDEWVYRNNDWTDGFWVTCKNWKEYE